MDDLRVSLSDEDLLSRLKNFEDNFVERKTSGDNKDWLKTVVDFANSTPIGYPAVLFIGVRDDGTPEGGLNLDTLQKTFADKMQVAFPSIYFVTKILEKDNSQFLAVIVPGSANRPHFAGPSYVRKGSRTEVASEQQFNEVLATRLSKSGEILKWVGKVICVEWMRNENIHQFGPIAQARVLFVTACNSFYVTLADQMGKPGTSVPLRRVEISYDNNNDRLKLEIYLV